MATYTVSILDMLQRGAGEDETLNPMDPLFLDSVEDIATRVIFPPSGLEAIATENRGTFVRGFCTHFLMDEIGIESIFGWQMRLAGVLHENGEYIDSIYELARKQVFSDYTTRKTTRQALGTSNETTVNDTTSEGEVNVANDSKTDSTTSNTEQSDSTNENNVTTDVTGSTSNTTGGKDTTTHNDKVTVEGSGSSTDGGTTTYTKSGSETTAVQNGLKNVTTIKTDSTNVPGQGVITESDDLKSFPTTRTTETQDKTQQRNFQLPQQGVSGNIFVDGRTTTAAESVDTNTVTETGSEKNVANSTVKDYSGTKGNTDTTSINSGTDTNTTTFNGRTDTDKHGKTVNTTDNNETTSVGSNETTFGKTDTGSNTSKNVAEGGSTDHSESLSSGTGSSTVEGNTNTETTSTGTSSGTRESDTTTDEDVQEESYNVSMEALMRAEPIIKRIWSLFDDLFMGII